MSDFKLNFIHLCDEATFSQEGKLSLIGIFDVVNVVNIPGNLLKAVLVCNFSILNPSVKNVKVDIFIEKEGEKEPIFKIPTLNAKFPPGLKEGMEQENKIGFTVQLGNLRFNSEGIYQINFIANDNMVGTYKFLVKRIQPKGTVN
jgi:hypothetical protein